MANFYTRFSHEAQSAYSVLLPRSYNTQSMLDGTKKVLYLRQK